jgi:cephalosporin hydroxylase
VRRPIYEDFGNRLVAEIRRRARLQLERPLIVNAFHRAFYYAARDQGLTWLSTSWLGVPTLKCPLDLWVYQEILLERRPDVIVESGTNRGGSALYLASICDLIDHGRVVTIDIEDHGTRPHPRITYLIGSSTAQSTIERVQAMIDGANDVMVILDSDHEREHVLKELRLYSQVVTPGQYLIVEDTNINGHPVFPEHGPGPSEALSVFLAENGSFIRDREREKLLLTFNTGGYLLRTE